jgi:hypothetical protein
MQGTLPRWNDSWGWLLFYGEALAGNCGEHWRRVAIAHEPSGRTDGTSWRNWRDEVHNAPPPVRVVSR